MNARICEPALYHNDEMTHCQHKHRELHVDGIRDILTVIVHSAVSPLIRYNVIQYGCTEQWLTICNKIKVQYMLLSLIIIHVDHR